MVASDAKLVIVVALAAVAAGCNGTFRPWTAATAKVTVVPENECPVASAAASPAEPAERQPAAQRTAKVVGASHAAAADAALTAPAAADGREDAAHAGADTAIRVSAADAQSLAELIVELENHPTIEPAKRKEWLDALRQSDPKMLPLLIPTCRAYLAISRQAVQKEPPFSSSQDRAAGAASAAEPAAQRVEPDRTTMAFQGGYRAADMASLPAISPRSAPPVEHRAEEARFDRQAAEEVERAAHEGPRRALDDERPPDASYAQAAVGTSREAAADVVRTAYNSPQEDDWREHLDHAVQALRRSAGPSPQTPRETADHARLRLLSLAAGRRDEALEPIPELDPALQDFWAKELFGVATLLDTDLIADSSRRTAEAKRSLEEAVARLGEASPLVVRNLAFVRRVDSWGMYEPVDTYEFAASQKVMLYAEVENFKSAESARGYHTALRSSYQVFDSRGQRVAEYEFATNEEYCRNLRRDYFFGYEFVLPKNLYPGKYILQLTVADLNNQKIGQSSIEFTVKDAAGS